MGIRSRKPTSPGRRFQTVSDFAEITRIDPRSRSLRPKPSTGGRNNQGRITARHRGGGHKRQYRIVDFERRKDGVPAKVAAIEYDPNRNAASRCSTTTTARSATSSPPRGVGVGDVVQSGQGSDIQPGNALPLRYIPVGTVVHNVELKPGAGGKMARSAGASVQLVAKEGDFATVRLPSTEMRRVPDRLPGHRRLGGQRRGLPHQAGQGRPQALEGPAPADPWCGHEPERPPPGRWRGQDLRRPPPGVAVGQARGPHPQPEEGIRADDRPSSPHPWVPEVVAPVPRSLKKGPFVDDHLREEDRRPERQRREAGHQDVVRAAPRHAGDGRPHDGRARRPQARARLRDRVDGRPQARGVRAHPHVPLPRGTGEVDAPPLTLCPLPGAARAPGRRTPILFEGTTMPDTQAPPATRASVRYLRGSAFKIRPVLALIRGKSASDARDVLRLSERDAAQDVLKVLESAIANAEHNASIPEDELFVSEAFADEGPTMKRWRPRARGRATRIRKRTSHVTIVLSRYTEVQLSRIATSERGTAAERRRRLLRRRGQEVAAARQAADHAHDHEGHDHEGHDHDEVPGTSPPWATPPPARWLR